MNIQTLREYREALDAWIKFDRKGTMPRKVRANSAERKQSQRAKRVKRDRMKRTSTKRMNRTRLSRGQEIRTGKR